MKKKVILTLVIIIALLIGYLLTARYYTTHFLPNTMIGKYEVSGKTLEKADSYICSDIENLYTLSIVSRNSKEYINGEKINYKISSNVNEIWEHNNGYKWFESLFQQNKHNLYYTVSYSEEMLLKEIYSLKCIQKENMEFPVSAYISEYVIGEGYKIIPEEKGTLLDEKKVIEAIKTAVKDAKTEINIDNINCYIEPDETKESESLNEMLERLNKVASSSISYKIGDSIKVLNSDIFYQWIITDESGNISLNQDMVKEYVTTLAKETDTAYTKRDFKTTSGSTVKVEGPYGYRIDKEAESEQLMNEILSGTQVEREPVYSMTGAGREGSDYGNTYVEIDLTNQIVYLYVDGQLIQSSKCVTGNVAKGHTTPPGIYPLTYKQKDAVLRGPGYASPVKFWMPFNGGIGLHDASWRSSFGGNIYKTNGSHGCVNLPYDMAKTLYENVYKGMPIICYN